MLCTVLISMHYLHAHITFVYIYLCAFHVCVNCYFGHTETESAQFASMLYIGAMFVLPSCLWKCLYIVCLSRLGFSIALAPRGFVQCNTRRASINVFEKKSRYFLFFCKVDPRTIFCRRTSALWVSETLKHDWESRAGLVIM